MASSPIVLAKDTVIEAIRAGSLGAGHISYPLIRRIAGRDCGCWSELDRGRAILTSIEQLDQYLYSYGPMTHAQWNQVLPSIQLPAGSLQIIDYGCGQGLASAMLFDHFGAELARRTSTVILVEPSSVALTRAEAILSRYAPNADVIAFNKFLDDVTAQDLKPNGKSHVIHLLSNVLDIKSFDHIGLLGKILHTKGRHTIQCVSHNRNFHGGSGRFHEFAEAVNDFACQAKLSVQKSTITEFRCPRGQEAISLQLRVEVHHGSV